ncbi:MAG: efflux RND transporter periplasmic adaptor subunit [Balneolaceae bacterium]|nr:efflux RND transporter periplasmic adaptor subunit [Balneolaceae bacterium]
MKLKKKYIYPAVLLAILFVTWLTVGAESSEEPVLYTQPAVGYFEVTITSSGELQAQNSTSITAPENMRRFRINNVPILNLVDEGTVVEKGEFVAELDRSSLSNTLQDALLSLEEEETQLEQARLDTALTLSAARNNIVDLEYAAEQAQLVVEQSQYESPAVQRQVQIEQEQAQLRLKQARENYQTQVRQAEANVRRRQTEVQEERNDVQRIREILDQFTIYAPENGMVIYKRNRDGSKVKEGSSISAWDPVVAELPDFSVMESLTYINEVDIQKVRVGQRVDIGLDAMPEKELTGQVTSVANIGEQRPNSNSKVFQVTIRVNESDSTLRPAMTTSNTIHISSVDSALYVPLETIHTYNDMDIVYKREGQSPVMQEIVMGMMNENNVVILEGVDISDRLYLSMPTDTTGIERRTLPTEILQEYEQPEQIARQE